MEGAGAAKTIPDDVLEPALLAVRVKELLGDPAQLEKMAAAARDLARPDAAERIASEVLAVAG
jgi:UDP-N-acetylglucosamine--N-acetylmuramyl-(pentapeptide) pyrophosphoryl-undecaprenol N-acetylglucosamine transferase